MLNTAFDKGQELLATEAHLINLLCLNFQIWCELCRM